MSSKTFFVNILDRSGKATQIKWADVWKSEKITFAAPPSSKTLATVINQLSSAEKKDFNEKLGSKIFSAKIVNLVNAGAAATAKCVPSKAKPTFVVKDGSACYKEGTKTMTLTVTRSTSGLVDAPLTRAASTGITAFDPFTDASENTWFILLEIKGNAKFVWETSEDEDDEDEDKEETTKDDDLTFWFLLGGSLLLACLAIIFVVLFMYM